MPAHSTVPSQPQSPQETALNVIENVIQHIEHNSLILTRPGLFEGTIDLGELRRMSKEEILKTFKDNPAASAEDVAAGIINLIARKVRAIDHHTFFARDTKPKTSTTNSLSALVAPTPKPTAVVEDGIAILSLPWCVGDPKHCGAYIEAGRRALEECEKQNPRAWVIDLRRNSGGNMWPMLAVVLPLLETDAPGAFNSPRVKETQTWKIPETFWEMWRTTNQSPVLRKNYPVAVWTSQDTASSGEITSIMFRGRPNTRFFGDRTAGVPTGNQPFNFEGIGTLQLTTTQCQDRTGYTHPPEKLNPDEYLEVPVPDESCPPESDEFKTRFQANTKELLKVTKEWLDKP